MTAPKDCIRFQECSAPLCPLDPDIKERVWWAGEEDICKSRKHAKGLRWIKKQRSVVRRHTKSYFGTPITYEKLFDASRPRKMTEEQKRAAAERLKKMREEKCLDSKYRRNQSKRTRSV